MIAEEPTEYERLAKAHSDGWKDWPVYAPAPVKGYEFKNIGGWVLSKPKIKVKHILLFGFAEFVLGFDAKWNV